MEEVVPYAKPISGYDYGNGTVKKIHNQRKSRVIYPNEVGDELKRMHGFNYILNCYEEILDKVRPFMPKNLDFRKIRDV